MPTLPKIRRIDFSPAEWLEGTAELSDDDRGVYITICALIWARGRRINLELLRRHSLSHGNKLLASLGRLEKSRKIVRKGLEIGQKRAEKELKNAQTRSRTAAENARHRWKTKEIEDAPAERPHVPAQSSRNANHQPSTINHQKTTPLPPNKGGKFASHNEGNGATLPTEPWPQRLRAFKKSGFWNDFWGPKPGATGCTVPARFLSTS